jgi:tetratricopeptide (TPR) repeat protein
MPQTSEGIQSGNLDTKPPGLPLKLGSWLRELGGLWPLIILFLFVSSDFKHHDPPRAEDTWFNAFMALGLVVLLFLGTLHIARRSTIGLALQARFEQALRWNRRLLWIPGYGGSLEGWILITAGRYIEAQDATRPGAFGKHGDPRLGSWQLYYYAMALSHQGNGTEAQELLEAALRLKPSIGRFYLGLADCLLEHDKDPDRARQLLDRMLTNWEEADYPSRTRAKASLRRGRYAWALARCEQRDDAIIQMREAAVESAKFLNYDQAWLQYYAGEAWRALGDTDKARTAFEAAIAVHPHGQVEQRTQKGLLELGHAT